MSQQFSLWLDDLGLPILGGMKEDELVMFDKFGELRPDVINDKHRTYSLINPHLVYGRRFYIRFHFFDSRLANLQLHAAQGETSGYVPYDAATAQKEKEGNDAWLKDRLGLHSSCHVWGKVESIVDRRDQSASIFFSFGAPIV